MKGALQRLVLCTVVVLPLLLPAGAGVVDSKHNLSVSGPGEVTAESESEVCIFCHISHAANPAEPLWNHKLSSTRAYSTYSSSTMSIPNALGQPTGASKLCLSCHDGTVALGETISDGLLALRNTESGGRMMPGSSNLGMDLTDDHPVSFRPNPTDTGTENPPFGDPVQLDAKGEIQCTTCHDPHIEDLDPVSRRFLVKSNRGSALCVTCHRMEGWNMTSHQSSTATYGAEQGAHTGYTTVHDNGCESCHRPHSATVPQRNLKRTEEETCNPCHDGSVAAKDVVSEFLKPYSHPTLSITPSTHEANESPNSPSSALPEIAPGVRRHAECSDCHNPHAAAARSETMLEGAAVVSAAWGIDGSGSMKRAATAEQEICYKCHGDSANKPQVAGLPNPPYVQRQHPQFNTRLEFDPLNPSHHAVEGPGRNPDVPSLLQPWTTASVLRCTDCHNSDTNAAEGGRSGARGPHGSNYNHILERNLNEGDHNSGGDFSYMYALCFKCHSEASIMADESFPQHRLHIDGEDTSCTVCHDSHGVSRRQGNGRNNTHLINFDLSVVSPDPEGRLEFEDRGALAGACYLSCHNSEHQPKGYP